MYSRLFSFTPPFSPYRLVRAFKMAVILGCIDFVLGKLIASLTGDSSQCCEAKH